MFLFSIPKWVIPHLFINKDFVDLSEKELNDLKSRISLFQDDDPEVSIVIPAWNEANNIYRALSSLADSNSKRKIEIIVINNNSTDNTQKVLEVLGVRNYFQPLQGTPHARQMGLFKARGKYHLCADSDTFYPPDWVDSMIAPMERNQKIVGVYGRYCFMPPKHTGRVLLWIYERFTGIIIRIRKINKEFINVLGFNMGFVTEVGRTTGGFEVTEVRKFDNALGSEYFVEEAEDGRMAINLQKQGKLKLVTSCNARVFTSSRRLTAEGGIAQSFLNRFKIHTSRFREYLTGR